MTPNHFKFSIIVPTYNRLDLLQNCLKCLDAQTVPAEDFEIVIVDDGSTKPLRKEDLSESNCQNLTLIRLGKNSGPSVARNTGISAAHGDVICFTDSDCEPEPDWLEQIDISINIDGVDYVGGATNCRRTGEYANFPFSDNPFTAYELKPGDIHFPTCNLAFRREVLRVCRFDESRLLLWLEDSALCWQAHRLGYKACYNPNMFVIHPLRYIPFFKNLTKQKKCIAVGYIRAKFTEEFDKEFLGRLRFTHWTRESKYFFLILAAVLCAFYGYLWLVILMTILGTRYIDLKTRQLRAMLKAIPLYKEKKHPFFYMDLTLTFICTPLISIIRSFFVFVGGIRYGQIIF